MNKNIKILFATDFSPSSKAALANLKRLKNVSELDIHFIHVFASFWKDWLSSGLQQKEAMQRLESWQKELLGHVDSSKLQVHVGNPANHILAAAAEIKPDLIMIGGKNPDEKSRYKSGGTVENVVRNAKQSVLLSKPNDLGKIMCGIDCSPASKKALQWAINMAKKLQAKLSVVYVIPKSSAQALGMEEADLAAEEEKKKKEVTQKMESFLEAFDLSNIDVEQQIRWGRPSHVMLDMAEDLNYDIIVIGAKGHSRLEHVLMGSTSDKILRFVPCSLFVVR